MKLLAAALLLAAAASAQDAPANPLIASSRGMFAIAKNDILASANKIPPEMWSFKPTPEVRSIAQLLAHVADGQYEFCNLAAGTNVSKNIEKTFKSNDDIMTGLNNAFAFCEATYAQMTDADAPTLVSMFGRRLSKLGAMDFNIAHTMEHYGNLVTYMRLKGIVPPSSEPRQPATSKKQ